jgi:DtxR family transcriptional regulator, Mn-dependent transcriptional regulator
MPLSESLENYLEAIYEIKEKRSIVRVRDVAKKLGVTMPSVNGALKSLEAKGFINHEKYEYIELSDTGTYQASIILNRHRTIFRFLNEILRVDNETAEKEACKIEHDLCVDTIKKLSEFLDGNSAT